MTGRRAGILATLCFLLSACGAGAGAPPPALSPGGASSPPATTASPGASSASSAGSSGSAASGSAGAAINSDSAAPAGSPSALPTWPVQIPVPPSPAQMAEDSVEGAIAAGQYLFTLLDYATITGDIAPLTPLAGEQCDWCQHQIAKREETDFRPRQPTVFSFSDARGRWNDPIAAYTVQFSVSHPPNPVVNRKGAEKTDRAEEFFVTMRIFRSGNNWIVDAVGMNDDILDGGV
ncbi:MULTISPECIES: DUF6318 family protein [Actinotignum]|uniref:DUF6318 family protein n=1 Tax=Actinotignum TaxID=1653174 RepID=UPI002A81EE2C|nr:DUF6318 family protein [Actinotignum timonense]MDY5134145.1 DUF6318 family protein [Actinotignum timonense]MDY5156449.1 DUF6318 family protein [Actinotignum timonense]